MNSKMDPMGRAILDYVKRQGRAADYWKTKKASKLRVFSPMFEEDEIPLTTLFRKYKAMPKVERKALDMAKGKTLDVGAGSGCHSLVLQEKGIDVTAIDISPLSVETMKERGVKKVMEQDFFTLEGQQYDTILMLMNGIGIVGTWGPKKVIFVIGLNKVAQTTEAALARARSIASPINAQRFDINTPCRIDGTCHNCNSPESICSYVHFLRNSRNKGRHVVVLVGEDLGY